MFDLSVVIPLYNNATTLRRAVDSVTKQSGICEIIVVDDCSVDKSFSIAIELKKTLPNLRVIQTEKNSGPGAARNTGAKVSQGKFLFFLDADDEYLGECFSDVIPLMTENNSVHALKFGMEFFDPVKGYVLPSFDPRYAAVTFSSPCNMIIRKRTFEQLGGFPEDPVFRDKNGGEDIAFCKALSEIFGPIGFIDNVYYRCWSYEGSHLDNFLATTRLSDNSDGFEFVGVGEARKPGGGLESAMRHYTDTVKARVAGLISD